MQNTYTAIIKKEDNWWIGWIEEIPGVNCQEATREELLESLKITLEEALELNRTEANDQLNKRSAVPRHSEIKDILVKKICKDLGIPSLK
jgi:predicted RNase H-like HicB family nuclease